MAREDTPVSEEVDPGPVASGKVVKGRAPGVALKLMEEFQANLIERGIEVEHWRSAPEVALHEIDWLRSSNDELAKNPLIRIDTRIAELEDGLADAGQECPEGEQIVPFTIALVKSFDQSLAQQGRSLGALRVSVETAQAEINDKTDEIQRLTAELEEARATKDLHKDRYQEELAAHTATEALLDEAKAALVEKTEEVESWQTDFNDLKAFFSAYRDSHWPQTTWLTKVTCEHHWHTVNHKDASPEYRCCWCGKKKNEPQIDKIQVCNRDEW